jgi:hypothetical protein
MFPEGYLTQSWGRHRTPNHLLEGIVISVVQRRCHSEPQLQIGERLILPGLARSR